MNAAMNGADVALSSTLQALARLIDYPDSALRLMLPELRATLHAGARAGVALSVSRLRGLDALLEAIGAADPLDAEADHVRLFDSGRATALHLFEHVHGDSRERGPALVDLRSSYEEAGLSLAPGELPDYLPVFLEFASTQPPSEARSLLAEVAHILDAIHGALRRHDSLYAEVLAALVELAGETPVAPEPPTDDPLDERWEEPAAFDGCMTRGQRPPPRTLADAVRIIDIERRTAVPGSLNGGSP